MRAAAAKSEGKRLDRPVEIGARKTKGCIKPVAEPRNYPLSALRKPSSHHSTPKKLDRGVRLGQSSHQDVPLGEYRFNGGAIMIGTPASTTDPKHNIDKIAMGGI
jgi:hypothetical protein